MRLTCCAQCRQAARGQGQRVRSADGAAEQAVLRARRGRGDERGGFAQGAAQSGGESQTRTTRLFQPGTQRCPPALRQQEAVPDTSLDAPTCPALVAKLIGGLSLSLSLSLSVSLSFCDARGGNVSCVSVAQVAWLWARVREWTWPRCRLCTPERSWWTWASP